MTTTRKRVRPLRQETQQLAQMAFCGDCPWHHHGPDTQLSATRHARITHHPVRVVTTTALDLVPRDPR